MALSQQLFIETGRILPTSTCMHAIGRSQALISGSEDFFGVPNHYMHILLSVSDIFYSSSWSVN